MFHSSASSHQHSLDMSSHSMNTSSESDLVRNRENENSDINTGNQNVQPPSGDNQLPNERSKSKRSRYQRHTQQQIQEMEAFFKECPHPDEKQRGELGNLLGLDSLQIKFWFQNKRTQVKTIKERSDNVALKAENEELRAENENYKQILTNTKCHGCGGPPPPEILTFEGQQMRLENVQLRDQIERMTRMMANCAAQPATSYPNVPSCQHNIINMHLSSLNQGIGNVPSSHQHNHMPSSSLNQGIGNVPCSQHNNINMRNVPCSQHNNINMPSSSLNQGVRNYGAQSSGTVGEMSEGGGGGGGDPLRSLPVPADGSDKPMIEELAAASLEELTTLALAGKPLWVHGSHNAEILNEREYFRTFPGGIGPKPLGFKSESSRESMVITMNHINLIEMLMDVDIWSRVFCGIVSRAATLEVLSTGLEGSYDENLLVVSAEFQVPSPLVPPREYYFLRYCKKLSDESWVVVDVSLETVRPSATVPTSRRRPSGCLIQALPNGYSTKVTWVEHVEVEDRALAVHSIYKLLVDSGLAFGARRWVASLDRRCERIASTLATNIPQGKLSVTNREGRKGLLRLAERMVMSFCTGVGASTAQAWTTLTPAGGHNNIRIMTRKGKDEQGRPSGIVIGAATSFRLPVPPNRFFDWIRSANVRSEWDILSTGGVAEEFARIANGRDPGNCVSLLRVKSSNPKHNNMIILQESCTDSTGSLVIYAPIDVVSINSVLGGRDPDHLPMLPSGFAILSDGRPIVAVGSGSCLITVAFQILIESEPTKKISICSVSTVNQLVKCTVDKIKAVVPSNRT